MHKSTKAVLMAALAVGAVIGLTAGPALATPADKVFVCKYVGTPGVDERLQTGQNPISVSVNAIPGEVFIGAEFADKHGKSIVIGWDTRTGGGQEGEPSIDACPAPVGPPEEPEVPEKPPVRIEESSSTVADCETRVVTTTHVKLSYDSVLVDNVWVEQEPTAEYRETTRPARHNECPVVVQPPVDEEPPAIVPPAAERNPVTPPAVTPVTELEELPHTM